MDNEHERAIPPDHSIDKAPKKFAVRRKPVGIGAGVFELFGVAHADQVRRHAAAEPGHLRHDVAPEIGRSRIAVQKEKRRFAFAELDIGHALAVDEGEFLGVRIDAVWRHLNSSQKAERRVLFWPMIVSVPSCEEVEHAEAKV